MKCTSRHTLEVHGPKLAALDGQPPIVCLAKAPTVRRPIVVCEPWRARVLQDRGGRHDHKSGLFASGHGSNRTFTSSTQTASSTGCQEEAAHYTHSRTPVAFSITAFPITGRCCGSIDTSTHTLSTYTGGFLMAAANPKTKAQHKGRSTHVDFASGTFPESPHPQNRLLSAFERDVAVKLACIDCRQSTNCMMQKHVQDEGSNRRKQKVIKNTKPTHLLSCLLQTRDQSKDIKVPTEHHQAGPIRRPKRTIRAFLNNIHGTRHSKSGCECKPHVRPSVDADQRSSELWHQCTQRFRST